jgi:hypothetical protein
LFTCFFSTAAAATSVFFNGALPPGKCFVGAFASGLRGVQSEGGKAIRQNRGDGTSNSIPTSRLPVRSGPRWTTRQTSCSRVCSFLIPRSWPISTVKARCMSAPWAFTMRVCVSSEATLVPGPSRRTKIGSLRQTRWLRRNCNILLVVCSSVGFMATVSRCSYRHFCGQTLVRGVFPNWEYPRF